MTAQGKTEGRHPGSPLSPHFYDPARVAHKIRLTHFVPPIQGGKDLWETAYLGWRTSSLPWAIMFCPFRAFPQPY